MNFAALSRQPEDDFEESSNVYDSLLNVSQEGAGFQTQMAIGLSLSEVREIYIFAFHVYSLDGASLCASQCEICDRQEATNA